jgi:two-component system nitrate/nitrite response regulator NarL
LRNIDSLRDVSAVSFLDEEVGERRVADDQDPTPLAKNAMVHIFIVHRSQLLIEGLTALFAKERDIHVVGTSTSGESAALHMHGVRDGIVLLDADLAINDPTLLSAMTASESATRVVLLMDGLDDDLVLSAMRAGVRGVILQTMGSRLLLNCLRKVHAGEEWLEQGSSRRLLHRFARHQLHATTSLSQRELQVVRGIARGLTNEQIGRELFINSATVKSHVHNIYRKLNVGNRVSVSTYARAQGLV